MARVSEGEVACFLWLGFFPSGVIAMSELMHKPFK